MNWALLLLSLCFVLGWSKGDQSARSADECDEAKCQLPDCRCSSTSIPGGLPPNRTPQFLMFTFSNQVNIVNMNTYRSLLYARDNHNGCPVGASFYVKHENTDYALVSELSNVGFEIGLHSISHDNETYFKEADLERMMLEFADQKIQMSHFSGISGEFLQGMRIPHLQLSGDASFQMMQKAGLRYDISWPTVKYTNPGLWPYTLHYASTQDCVRPPCPTSSLPGPWVVPMIAWTDLEGEPCLTADTCPNSPGSQDENGWFVLMMKNFERHYLGNRAPFGFFVTEPTIRHMPGFWRALNRFLNQVTSIPDVFMVNVREVVDWVQNPIPVEEYRARPCRRVDFRRCIQNFCPNLYARHLDKDMTMSVCSSCPRIYPWVGNPLGR